MQFETKILILVSESEFPFELRAGGIGELQDPSLILAFCALLTQNLAIMTQIKSKELLIKEMLARYKHYKLKDETAEFWREMKAIRAAVEASGRKERKQAVRSKQKDQN